MELLEEDTSRFLAAWMGIRQLVQASNFNRFQRAGLSATQFMTLNVIPQEGMTLADLSRRLNLSAATLNATVNSLAERGLVRRTRHATDARKWNIRATRRGHGMQNAASHEFQDFIGGLFGKMSRRRRRYLLDGLEELVQLGDASAKPQTVATRRPGGAVPAERSGGRSQRL